MLKPFKVRIAGWTSKKGKQPLPYAMTPDWVFGKLFCKDVLIAKRWPQDVEIKPGQLWKVRIISKSAMKTVFIELINKLD